MKTMYPPYDFIVVFLLTFVGGVIIRRVLTRTGRHRLAGSWMSFAVAYIVFTLILAFIWNDLPLKFYGPKKPYDFDAQISRGPDIGKGLVGGLIFVLSVITNLGLWGLSLFLIIKSFILDNRNSRNKILDDAN